MKKEDYEAWQGMELTQQVFRLIKHKQKQQNEEAVNGALLRPTNDESIQLMAQLIGFNKAISSLPELKYEDLVEPIEEENELATGN